VKAFTIQPWGPKKLREIFKSIVDAINARTPIEGLGVNVEEHPEGLQIHAEIGAAGAADGGTPGGSGGGPVDLYGALSGAPAVFHLLQSSPPTSPPP
jgi:hypothetical protein